MQRWLKSIFAVGRPLGAMLCVIGFFTLLDFALHGSEATFWSKQNLQSISVQNAFVAICSIGMLLVIISGGIDLSAGVALALSSTILAWGIREDVGFILSHGENVAGAVARLKTAENSLHDAKARKQPDQLEQANAEVDVRRRRLIELLQMKRSQLESVVKLDESRHASIDEKLADVTKAISELQNPNNSIDADPAWLRSLPNAASSTWLALTMGIGTGALCGLANGILIVVLRVVPFIATLGTMTIFLGLAMIVADETSVRPSAMQIPDWFSELSAVRPNPAWLLVSKGVWLALGLSALMACLLRYSVFGRHVFAIGSSEATARLCGIDVSASENRGLYAFWAAGWHRLGMFFCPLEFRQSDGRHGSGVEVYCRGGDRRRKLKRWPRNRVGHTGRDGHHGNYRERRYIIGIEESHAIYRVGDHHHRRRVDRPIATPARVN